MKNNKKWIILGLLLTAISVATACDSTEETQENESIENTADAADDTTGDSAEDDSSADENSLGEFKTIDIYGAEVTQDIFADYDITLVNLFATWCGPCINEMPELAQLHKDMSADGVNVVAVVLDAGTSEQMSDDVLGTAREIAELTGAEFTFMVPDVTNLNGRLLGVAAVPESFFVDSNGNIVGETYVGARDYDTWKAIVELELANLQGAE